MKNTRIGLIGYPLTHSYSPVIWQEIFKEEGLTDFSYELFEIQDISEFSSLFKKHNLLGANVTIPHKKTIIPLLEDLTEEAKGVGAVNTVTKSKSGIFIGHNTDAVAFEISLLRFLRGFKPDSALILGTGGGAAAVAFVLSKIGIKHTFVSRNKSGDLVRTYDEINSAGGPYPELIINTTPLGMYPNVQSFPPLDYSKIRSNSFCFDLIYNPRLTVFLQRCEQQNAFVTNGLEMLHLQARKSWEFISSSVL